jgi:hypothetical protein
MNKTTMRPETDEDSSASAGERRLYGSVKAAVAGQNVYLSSWLTT